MNYMMKPEPFLAFLKQAMSKRSIGENGTEDRGPFTFTRTFELVFVGPCSTDAWDTTRKPTVEAPLGMSAGSNKESTLHSVISQTGAKSVLLISGCCGEYTDSHSEIIRASHPEVEFTIPRVPDFCDNLFVHGRKDHVWALITHLRKQGLMH